MTSPREYPRSKALYERACASLAGGVSSQFRRAGAPHPLFYAQAHGSRITDVDGNSFLDFALSQGPTILGHSHPEVLDAVARASADGQIYAGQHVAELELAETLQRLIPCAELLRFTLSGSEAVHAALRAARAATGRPRFVRFAGHYHGWFDNVTPGISGDTPWTGGLPERVADESVVLPWNDLAAVEQALARRGPEIAALITEPVMCNSGCIPPEPGFLEGLRALCTRHGIVLIFDEVITGFRMGLGGAQKHFGVTPDLAIFGKAMASGYPIAAVVGRRAVMETIADGRAIHAGTMNSSVPCVAAAAATLRVLERDHLHARLFALAERLESGLRGAAEAAGTPLHVQGVGPMRHAGFTPIAKVADHAATLSYDSARYAGVVRALQDRDIRVIGRGLWYVCAAHTDDEIDHAAATLAQVLAHP